MKRVVASSVVVVLILLAWAAFHVTRREPRTSRASRVAVVLDAIETHASIHQGLKRLYCGPDGGCSSWRYWVARYINSPALDFGDAEMSWNDERMEAWRHQSIPALCHPENSTDTAVMAIYGKGTAWDQLGGLRPDRLPSDVVVLVESPRLTAHWMRPVDIAVEELQDRKDARIVDVFGGDIIVAFADGEVWAIRGATPLSVMSPFWTVSGAESADRSLTLSKHRIR